MHITPYFIPPKNSRTSLYRRLKGFCNTSTYRREISKQSWVMNFRTPCSFSFLSSRTMHTPFITTSVSGLLVIYLLFIVKMNLFWKLVCWVRLDRMLKPGFSGPLDPSWLGNMNEIYCQVFWSRWQDLPTVRTETDAHPMRFLCIGKHDLGILSPVDPDHRDRHSRRLKSPKDEEDSIDRIVDMALRAPIQ